jgi:hypothetical protein
VQAHAAVMDHLRERAERMIRSGGSADEAERRYTVPKAFQHFDMLWWNFTVGGAMRTCFAALRS